MADAGEAIALASVVDPSQAFILSFKTASFHQMAQVTLLDVVGAVFGISGCGNARPVGRGCSHHCDCSTASILAVASENNLLM